MKIIFNLATQTISIEGDGPDLVSVLEAARGIAPHISTIQISTAHGTEPKCAQDRNEGRENGGNAISATTTLRQFVRSVPLLNTAERIAGVAYYMKDRESRDTFSPKEMDNWFTIAGLQKPSQMPVGLFDARKRYGYVESAGHGKWRVTSQGENLVVGRLNVAENGQVTNS